MLIPQGARPHARDIQPVPIGLFEYANRHDWPASWARVRASLPQQPNLGMLLRWTAAIEEMRGYFALPMLLRAIALREFAAAVERSIARFPELCLWPRPDGFRADGFLADEFASQTVFPFGALIDGRPASYEEAAVLYRALNEDVSDRINATGRAGEIARSLCHIGQPVPVVVDGACVGALRVSADARFVSESWSSGGSARFSEQLDLHIAAVTTVFEKLRLLASRFADLHGKPD